MIDLNEALTEYFTYDITGIKNELHPYSFAFPLVEFLIDRLGKEQLIECCFSGNINIISLNLHKSLYKEILNHITNIVCLAKGKRYVDCQIYINTIGYLQRNDSQK